MAIITDVNLLNPPTIKASLSGLTVLHNHQYLYRYSGKKTGKPKANCTGSSPRKEDKTGQSENEPKKPRTYSINKSQVRKRILGIINQQSSHKQLFFYTVSFPPSVTDQLAYRLLNSVLTSLRQAHKVSKYD